MKKQKYTAEEIKRIKELQAQYVQEKNPRWENVNSTWINSAEDVLTLEEALSLPDWAGYDEFDPDYTLQDALEALKTQKIRVYSSKPIKAANFVTPSKMEAESYSGTGKIFTKNVNIYDVAWLDPTQGQYCPIKEIEP